jgi:hypothetical protein
MGRVRLHPKGRLMAPKYRRGRWSNALVCRVMSAVYDRRTRTGRVFMAPVHCCDMSGAIKLFQQVDPRVDRIETYAGGEPDTFPILGRRQVVDFINVSGGSTHRATMILRRSTPGSSECGETSIA